MTTNGTTERPSDAHITERAAELETVRHRLIRDATPQEPGFGPCVELSQFEDYAADADWLVQALLVRNAELRDEATRHSLAVIGGGNRADDAEAKLAKQDRNPDQVLVDLINHRWSCLYPTERSTLSIEQQRTISAKLIEEGVARAEAEEAARAAFEASR